METTYKIVGIDVHKSMLAVVVADAAAEGEFQFERRKFGTTESELRQLAQWLAERNVREAVMESTALYWRPVWQQLEGQCDLYLAQAQSNRAPRGRKRDFADAERLLRRHVAGELILSFVPGPEQRLWRTMTRAKHQLTRDRVRIHNQLESLWRTGGSSCPAVSAICSVSVAGACRRLWPKGKQMLHGWLPWRIPSCMPLPSSCRMHSAPPPV